MKTLDICMDLYYSIGAVRLIGIHSRSATSPRRRSSSNLDATNVGLVKQPPPPPQTSLRSRSSLS